MNLEKYYDDYWSVKDEGLDPERIAYVVSKVRVGDRVLDIGCGPGKMTQAVQEKEAQVTGVDFSNVIIEKAEARNVEVVKCDVDSEPLPFGEDTFDLVILTQTIEHLFNFHRVMGEIHRVLAPGGRLVLSIPNIAHWRFRLYLLCGRFPYIEDTQTHFQHIRFFTVKDTVALCEKEGLSVEEVAGTSALDWCPLYHWRMNTSPIRQMYELATKLWPSLFAFHVTLLCSKTAAAARRAA